MGAKKEEGKRYRILSLDGGGIRGILTAVWLEALEERLERGGGGRIADHFDFVAGTSTGSILACLVSLKTPAEEILQLYREFGPEVFPRTRARLWSRARRLFSQGVSAPKYDDRGLARALERRFRDTPFGALHVPTLVTSYDTLSRSAVVMKTWGEGSDRAGDYDAVKLWEVAKASSSAPTYFPAHVLDHEGTRMPLVDGGVVANNPSPCAIAEGVRVNSRRDRSEAVPLRRFVLASFGTGELTRPISIDDAREWGAIEWAVPIIDVLFDGAGDAIHYAARQLIPEGRYFRLQTRLDEAFDDMDDASETNMNALQLMARKYLENRGGGKQLDDLVELIL